MKHRALIVGAGRIGAGFAWMQTPYVYVHADAYLALKDRVDFLGFVEPDGDRAFAAQKKYGVPVWEHLEDALDVSKPDVVSICTQPEQRWEILSRLHGVNAVWSEKPLNCTPIDTPRSMISFPKHIQVNYWRRFEPMHRRIKDKLDAGELGEIVRLVVCAKRDVHTVCHMTDLALWWGVSQAKFTYCDVPAGDFTTCEYTLYTTKRVLRFICGGASCMEDSAQELPMIFPGMKLPYPKEARGWNPIFMTEALADLLNVTDGVTAKVKSPPESAIEAENWANEILENA